MRVGIIYIRDVSFRFFFFSSRRRHTRCGRDWSSDVCSSDLRVGRMAREERFHEAPLEVERIRICDRAAENDQMHPHCTPRSATTQIDEVRMVEQKLVAPLPRQEHPGYPSPDRVQRRMRALPL